MQTSKLGIAAVLMVTVTALALLVSVSKDIGDARKTENFAKHGRLLGSLQNLKESFRGWD